MLTIKECRELLGTEADHYTDEQLKLMLEFLTELASITVSELKRNEYETESSIDVPRVK